jgi:protein SCO1/2
MILKRSLILPLGVFLVAALTLLATILVLVPEPQQNQSQSRVPIGGPFRLTSHEGKPFTDQDLKGKPFVVFFGFTHCPEVCPTTLYDLTQDLESLGKDADRLKVAFITVDPAQDTPELMKTYLSSFDPRIVGLTGTEEEIATAARAYKVYYRKVPLDSGGYTMDHTASIFLMDSKGDFYGTSNFQEAQDVRRAKLRQLVKNG